MERWRLPGRAPGAVRLKNHPTPACVRDEWKSLDHPRNKSNRLLYSTLCRISFPLPFLMPNDELPPRFPLTMQMDITLYNLQCTNHKLAETVKSKDEEIKKRDALIQNLERQHAILSRNAQKGGRANEITGGCADVGITSLATLMEVRHSAFYFFFQFGVCQIGISSGHGQAEGIRGIEADWGTTYTVGSFVIQTQLLCFCHWAWGLPDWTWVFLDGQLSLCCTRHVVRGPVKVCEGGGRDHIRYWFRRHNHFVFAHRNHRTKLSFCRKVNRAPSTLLESWGSFDTPYVHGAWVSDRLCGLEPHHILPTSGR